MASAATTSDLIISLSRDKVSLKLLEEPGTGRKQWQTSFPIDGLYLADQIAGTLDQALLENPSLIDQFSNVDIMVVDRPNICVPRHYVETGQLGEIASKHLKLRVGDTLNTDVSEREEVICYTLPTDTLAMLKEYYANIHCHHLTSIIWYALSTQWIDLEKDKARLYFTTLRDSLMILVAKNGRLIFSKNFIFKDKADLYYYIIACSRMLHVQDRWHVAIEDEEPLFDMKDDELLKIDHFLTLPSLHELMTQYKLCES